MMRILAIGLSMLALIGCGGGGDNNTTNPTGPNTPTAYPVAASFHNCGPSDTYQVVAGQNYVNYGLYSFFIPEDIASFQCSNNPDYARDANNLYYRTGKFPFSNFSNLTFLSQKYASDGNTVFGAHASAHAPTFQLIDPSRSSHQARDRNSIFFEGNPLYNVDQNSYVVLSENVARDNTQIILGSNRSYTYDNAVFGGLDIANYQSLGGLFFKSPNEQIYYFNTNGGVRMILLTNADATSFQHISEDYAKDANTYYLGNGTFSDGSLELEFLGHYFSTDGVNIYRGRTILTGADPDTFVVHPYAFAYDATTIYRGYQGISGSFSKPANTSNLTVGEGGYIYTDDLVTDLRLRMEEDPANVTYLGGNYLAGANTVYYGGNANTADPATAEYIGLYRFNSSLLSFMKDANNVFYFAGALSQFDAASFELLSLDFAKDVNNVYHGNNAINGADAASFVVLGKYYSRDNTNVYFTRYTTTADPTQFVMINDDYGHDQASYYFQRNDFASYTVGSTLDIRPGNYAIVNSTSVFHEGNPVANVDVASFNVIAPYYIINRVSAMAVDINNLYTEDNVISGYSLDISNLRVWDGIYFGDDQNVFSYSARIASTAGFNPINNYYIQDGNQIKYINNAGTPTLLATADANTFAPISGRFAKDNDEVFYYDIVLAGMDPANSTQPYNGGLFIHDTDTLYYSSILVPNVDIPSVEFLVYTNGNFSSPTDYFKDNNNVWYRNQQIVGADAATFVLDSATTAHDAFNTYNRAQVQ